MYERVRFKGKVDLITHFVENAFATTTSMDLCLDDELGLRIASENVTGNGFSLMAVVGHLQDMIINW